MCSSEASSAEAASASATGSSPVSRIPREKSRQKTCRIWSADPANPSEGKKKAAEKREASSVSSRSDSESSGAPKNSNEISRAAGAGGGQPVAEKDAETKRIHQKNRNTGKTEKMKNDGKTENNVKNRKNGKTKNTENRKIRS